MTVGASTLTDERAYFSNHGKCVDVFAPGLNILSTWNGGNDTSNTISGTSMASPHICGLLAYLLSIHGTETFTILEGDSANTEAAGFYARAYSLLPRLVQAVLPVPVGMGTPLTLWPVGEDEDVDVTRPVPAKEITPAKLKKALIGLASPGMLTGLPAGTPNFLAFNNATLPGSNQ